MRRMIAWLLAALLFPAIALAQPVAPRGCPLAGCTFSGPVTFGAAGTGLIVTNNATIGGTLAVSGLLTAASGTLAITPSGGFGVITTTATLLLKSGSTGSNGLVQAFATLTAPKLTTTGNIAFSGAPSANQNGVQFKSTLSGTLSNGQQRYLDVILAGDTVNNSAGGALSAIGADHTTASGAAGNRWMIDVATAAGAAAPLGLQLGGIRTTATMSFNMGGTAFDSPGLLSQGNLWGANLVVQALSGATFLGGVVAQENDVAVAAGASTDTKFALALTQLATDRVQGVFDDTALSINNQSGSSPGWKTLIGVGRFHGQSPMDPANGWVMSFFPPLGAGTIAGAGGIDFTSFVPATAFIQGPNFLLAPTGVMTAAGYKVASTAGLTCAGTPTSSFASTGGIVTHC
jgi:hypothetical protein